MPLVRPVLKKPNLDTIALSNFRPSSNLPFLAKILEKSVLVQLKNQKQFWTQIVSLRHFSLRNHSTESALLRVLNDILVSVDYGDSVILVLLDRSAAFDTVDHTILISRLEQCVGIRGLALSWFKSFLCDITFSVGIGNSVSSVATLTSGVPQGSILAPTLGICSH